MAKRSIEETTLTNLANVIRQKTGKTGVLTPDGTMLEALATLPDAESLVVDKPTTLAQVVCLAKSRQMRDITYTLTADMPNYLPAEGYYPEGKVCTSIYYSSVRASDLFIGHDISLHTFMTAVHNPNSVLYTKCYNDVYKPEGVKNGVEGTWYGLNCSAFVSWCLGMPYHPATSVLPLTDGVTEYTDVDEMRLCDFINSNGRFGGSAGHTELVTGITRDTSGAVTSIELTHTYYGWTLTETVTRDDFITSYMVGQGYRLYRYNRLWECDYEPSPYIPQFDEPTDTVVYSNLCTDLGDKATLTTTESITVQPLATEGYTSIVVFKDGVQVKSIDITAWNGSTWAANEGVFDTPEAGYYVAVLVGADGDTTPTETNSTRWLVCDVDVVQEGTTYKFTHDKNCKPLSVVFKDGSGLHGDVGGKGMTLAYFEPTAEDIARGQITIEVVPYVKRFGDTEDDVKWITVAFINEYGCVHKHFAYTSSSTTTLPNAYTQVSYIAADGNQYIDTGVLASDHPDGISYVLNCNLTQKGASGKTDYLFGCLYNGSRSGNIGLTTSNILAFLGGGDGNTLRTADFTYGTDLKIKATATSANIADSTASVNGTNMAFQYAGINSAMPAANIYLLQANGCTGGRGLYGKLYGFTMTAADGTPLRNFVPCYRKADGVIGLYDTVGGTFYINGGTGAFTKGADV